MIGQTARPMIGRGPEDATIAASAERALGGPRRLRALPGVGPRPQGGRGPRARRRGPGRRGARSGPRPWAAAPPTCCATTTPMRRTGCRGGSCAATSCAGSTASTGSSGVDGGATDVVYELEVELVVPLPGFVKRRAEHKIMHTALDELRAHVERSPPRSPPCGSCCSPARAASARRRRRRPPRSPAPTGAPARSWCPPTRRTRSADAFDVELGDQPGRRSATASLWGQQLDATGADGGELGRDPGAGSRRCSTGPASRPSRPRSSPCCPGLDEVFALADIKTHADVGRLGRARRRLRARRPRRSGCLACPTSSAGTWSGCSRSAGG